METSNKTFPVVWAVRKKIGHTGFFSDDKSCILSWGSDTEKLDVKVFNIVEDWQGICAFFDGWESVDHTRANKTREYIFARNNYNSVDSIFLSLDGMYIFLFIFILSGAQNQLKLNIFTRKR